RATEIQYGQSITRGFLSSLKSERSKLDNEMDRLGQRIARELARDFNVPVKDIRGPNPGPIAHPAAKKETGTSNFNYSGTHHPTAEQKAQMKRELAALLG